MRLIADSGSTKTDWRLIDGTKVVQSFQSMGLSPYIQTEKAISEEIKKTFSNSSFTSSKLEIFYYGTGCSTVEKCEIMKRTMAETFSNATIHIEHDLLAAARAVCGNTPGITAIIGTGSNSCYYDGKEIKEQVVNLGYILGDEGSGMHIGKTFLQAYLYSELPATISKKFYDEYKLSREEILDAVRTQPMPNRFMGSFTKFVRENMQEPKLKAIVKNCFISFFDKHICKYPQHKTVPLNCVGSVALHFSDILKEVAEEKGVTIGKIINTPIEELVKFHS